MHEEELGPARTADVGGRTLRWHERGQGPPLVLIHGIPTSPALWRHVVPRLEGVRAISWEMLGYGASMQEGRDHPIGVADQAEHLAAWMRHQNIGPAVLGGHDLGGGVAQILAVRHPELCAGLFLTNAISYDSWPIPAVKTMQAGGAVTAAMPWPVLRGVLGSFIRRGHDDDERAKESVEVHLSLYERADAAYDFARQVRALRTEDTLAVQDDLPGLDVPARIVWGADDGFQKVAYGERLAKDLGADLERIEGGRHFTPEDHPESVAASLQDLMLEVRSRLSVRR